MVPKPETLVFATLSLNRLDNGAGSNDIEDVGDVPGWGGRIRTYDTRYQKPLPYHLATPQLWQG